jgi:hypothetical protein
MTFDRWGLRIPGLQTLAPGGRGATHPIEVMLG